MTKKKKSWCKPSEWGPKCKVAIAGLLLILSLIGGIWSLDKHWLPREIHDIAMAQTKATIEQTRSQLEVMGLQQQEFYWKRRESELKSELRVKPNDVRLQEDYREAVTERRRVEDEVRRLQTQQKK
jgi:hypothetical protein